MPNYYNDEVLSTITANENLVDGDLVYLDTSGWYTKADNTSDTTSSTELMIVVATISSGSTGFALTSGQYETTGLVSGDQYWVGSSGTYTTTQPTASGSIVRYVGTALSTTVLDFNPDGLYIEVGNAGGGVVATQPSLRTVTTSQTLLTTDHTLNVPTTGNTTQTLPTAVGVIGKIYNIKNSDTTTTSTITLNTTSSQLIDGYLTVTYGYPINMKVQSTGSNWIII